MDTDKFIKSNLIWIVSLLVALGGLLYSIKVQASTIDNLQTKHYETQDKIYALEKTMLRLENIECSLKEIKSDLKDIKNIIYKPVISASGEKAVAVK